MCDDSRPDPEPRCKACGDEDDLTACIECNALSCTECRVLIGPEYYCPSCAMCACKQPGTTTCIDCGKALCAACVRRDAEGEDVCAACLGGQWHCPNCGDIGGSPRTVGRSEWQGDGAHGGPVEWEDECCSRCIGGR